MKNTREAKWYHHYKAPRNFINEHKSGVLSTWAITFPPVTKLFTCSKSWHANMQMCLGVHNYAASLTGSEKFISIM